MADRFEELRTFATVVSAGGINAAAEQLGIAKSAVSKRLSDLEARLGVVLIDRTTRRFEPTAIGLDYFRRSRSILGSLEELDASLALRPPGQVVTIAAQPHVVRHVVLPALKDIEGSVSAFAGHVLNLEAGGSADIIIADRTSEGRRGRVLLETSLLTCASPGFLQAHGPVDRPGQIEGLVAVAIADLGAPEWRLDDRVRHPAGVALTVPDVDAGLSAALAGYGLVQLPDFVVSDALRTGRLVAVLPGVAAPSPALMASFETGADTGTREIVDALVDAVRRSRIRAGMPESDVA